MSETVFDATDDLKATVDPSAEKLWLDREHQARVSRVAHCDSSDGRRAAAESEMGRLTEDEQGLSAERKALGGEEHISAIERSSWFPYLPGIRMGSLLAWLLDSLFWTTLWVGLWWLWKGYYDDAGETPPAILYLALLAALIAGPVCAWVVKGFGRHFAVTRRTEPNSVIVTIDQQVRLAGKLAGIGIALALGVVGLLCFVPPSWTSWVTYVSGLVTFIANVCLGFSSGIGGNAADILEKPAVRDSIECQLEMKERTRRHLQRFLTVLLCVASLWIAGPSRAAEFGDTWVWAIDVSDSVDPDQRETGIEAMIRSAPTAAQLLGVRRILVVRFSEESVLADMTWIPVPAPVLGEDCTSARPERSVTKGLFGLSPHLALHRRQMAVRVCLDRLERVEQRSLRERHAMQERLRSATRITPRGDVTTRIAPLVQALLDRPYTRAILVLTDGIDRSGTAPSDLRLRDGVSLSLVIARPNPKRAWPTLDQVLAAARTWGQIDGIDVLSVAEYDGLWPAREGQ